MRNAYKRYFIVYILIALRTLFGYLTLRKHYTNTRLILFDRRRASVSLTRSLHHPSVCISQVSLTELRIGIFIFTNTS